MSMFALYAMMLIIGWQAYNLAREDMGIGASAGILGLLGLLQFVPLFILTPLVGWVADRLDRRGSGAALRRAQQPLSSLLLVKGLSRYSARGSAYIKALSKSILLFRLQRFDAAS